MAKYTVSDITRINAQGIAEPGKIYECVDGARYVGTLTKRLVAAQTNAALIGDGEVTNEAFNSLKGVISNIQEQVNNKLGASAFNGLTKITVGALPPSSPRLGDLWVDTSAP